jgi:hypothetical protein
MHRLIVSVIAACLIPVAAGALECPDWRRLDAAEKSAQLDGMVDGHLGSNVGKKFTSENPVFMRRCLEDFKQDLIDQFDGACQDERGTPKDAIDQIFDRYFLSCVQ